jgi:hypothetical protein
MESDGRHYADYHPELLYNLKDVIGLRYFLEFRCRTFINKLIKYYPDQFDPHYENNSREVLTQMAFDYKTINFINDWVDGVYSKNNYSYLSCVPHDILDNYLQLCEQYIHNFRECINKMTYIRTNDCPDDIKNIKLENFAELDLYRCKYKHAYFQISLKDNNIKNKEKNNRHEKNKIIEDDEKDINIRDKKNDRKTNILTQNSNKEQFWSRIADKKSLNNLKGMLPKNHDKYIIKLDSILDNEYKDNNNISEKKK